MGGAPRRFGRARDVKRRPERHFAVSPHGHHGGPCGESAAWWSVQGQMRWLRQTVLCRYSRDGSQDFLESSDRVADASVRLWEQFGTLLNRKISTDTTLQIALFAHSGGREQQKSDDGCARYRRGERSSACWDPLPAWGQQPQPFWASIPSQQPISHSHQVGPKASVGVVCKVILRSRPSATSSPGASSSCCRGIDSTPRTVEGQLVVRLVVTEQRRQVGVEAHSPAKRVRERQSVGQRVGHERAHPARVVVKAHRGFE